MHPAMYWQYMLTRPGNKLQHLLLHSLRDDLSPFLRKGFINIVKKGQPSHSSNAIMMHGTAILCERRSISHSDVQLVKEEDPTTIVMTFTSNHPQLFCINNKIKQ